MQAQPAIVEIKAQGAGLFKPPTQQAARDPRTGRIVLMRNAGIATFERNGAGVIIHQASGWGIQGGDQAVAYCAAKGGLVVMTKAMAIDHGRQGVRVNCLCPGDVETPMLVADAMARRLDYAEYMRGAANRPLGRVGLPDELARAALFLASDESSFMTGATLVVDGGGIAG